MKLWRKIAEKMRRKPERSKNNPKGRWKPINGRIDGDAPYMVRYYLFECRWFDIYIHQIMRSDDSPDFHDHPWPFFHVILEGRYFEESPDIFESLTTPGKQIVSFDHNLRKPGFMAFRPADYAHRLELTHGEVWTLVISGRKRREWGFLDRITGCWTQWRKYTEGERC